MTRFDGKIEIQHYVPRMLLSNFALSGNSKEPQVYVYDKHRKRVFRTNVANVAAERAFYDLDVAEGVVSAEPALSEVESKARSTIEKIVLEETLGSLTDEDRSWLAIFLAAQKTRTRHFRESILDSDKQLVQFLRDRGADPQKIKNYKPFTDEEEVKTFSTIFMIRNLPELAGHMLNKKWVLMRANPGSNFIIGDNPITMHNDLDFGPRGNLGLAVQGIQIHLPLSAKLTLALWCHSLADQISTGYDQAEKTVRTFDALLALGNNIDRQAILARKEQAIKIAKRLRADADSLKFGYPMQCNEDNMDFFNSLQARWAERFVMGSDRNFDIVERMLKDFPHSQRGPRSQVG